jgi:hypothetical protein
LQELPQPRQVPGREEVREKGQELMPAILDRLVKQLRAKGHDEKAAYAIATKSLQKSGNLKKGSSKATAKGKKRGKMTPGARAKDRAAKESGGKPSDYKYNAKTNRATKGGRKR